MGLKSIRTAARTRINSLLSGEGYRELENVFDVQSNPERLLDKGYGVRWAEGRSVRGQTRKVTTSGRITVILTYALPVRAADDVSTTVDDIYEDIDTLVESFFNATQLNGSVQIVENYSLRQPVLFESKKHVQIDVNFDVRYLTDISY